jgi:hypothetical protein
MDQRHIECTLLRARLLLTRSAVQRMGLRTHAEIRENYAAFLQECHASFKRALKLLIDDSLQLEKLLAELVTTGSDYKRRKAVYEYWLRLLALSYDTFILIASGHDRSEVLKHYKGPKHGALAKQNIESVIDVASDMNKDPEILAIPLDFSRFTCISDLLRIHRPSDGRVSADFIEVKEGPVNDEIFEVVGAKDPNEYRKFFDKYGDKGVAQVERMIRQGQVAGDRLKLFGLQPGIYTEEHALRIVSEMNIGEDGSFHDLIESLVQRARAGEYSVEPIGECLVVAALDATSQEKYQRTDYVARCVVHAAFGDAGETGDHEVLLRALQAIEFTDWRSGFGSPLSMPPLLWPLTGRCFLDLLFGRIQLHIHFHAASFVRLCTENGVRAGFLKKRTTNRLRSTRGWRKGEVPLFGGRAIGYMVGGLSAVFDRSYYDEILFNWRTPSTVVGHMKQLDRELRDAALPESKEGPMERLFSENDFERV